VLYFKQGTNKFYRTVYQRLTRTYSCR